MAPIYMYYNHPPPPQKKKKKKNCSISLFPYIIGFRARGVVEVSGHSEGDSQARRDREDGSGDRRCLLHVPQLELLGRP